MTRNTHRGSQVFAIAVSAWLVLGSSSADHALAQGMACSSPSPTCITLTLTANLQLTTLHSAVTQAGMSCTGTWANSSQVAGVSAPVAVVNRGFTGSVTVTLFVPAYLLADPARRTLTAACELRLSNGTSTKTAVASASKPEGMLDSNWEVVSAGSAVKWSQSVTFPNAAPAP